MFRKLITSFVAVLVFTIASVLYSGTFDVRSLNIDITNQAEETPAFLSNDFVTEFRRDFAEFPSTSSPKTELLLRLTELEDSAFASSSCPCSLSSMRYADVYEKQLSSTIPWINLTTRQALEKQHPNFPVNLLKNLDEKWCSLLPLPHLIKWHNIYFQSMKVSDTTYLLYSAFFDNRELTDLRPCIRILSYTRTKFPDVPWCYIWFNSTGPPIVSRVARTEYLDWQARSETRQMTFMLTCPIPKAEGHTVPLAVSVIARPCITAGTLLQVTGAMERNATTAFEGGEPARGRARKPGKEGGARWSVAVCGPALYYFHEDFSVRMVEWLEILRAQGFARVFLSVTDVHPNLERVLRYYEARGFVGLVRFAYPEPYVNEPSIRRLWFLLEKPKRYAMQKVYYTDCALRHMHEYRFIAHFDPDEIPMLRRHETFPQWLSDQLNSHPVLPGDERKQPPAHKLIWYYHQKNLEPAPSAASLPEYLWAMRHTKRSLEDMAVSTGKTKPVYDMDLATGLFSHDVLTCAYGTTVTISASNPTPPWKKRFS
ncbi:uncharacterized protein LOC119580842 isoform X2 [Penaeus monodon]|uniref:uncharacterized protein LOC119580842 isoform X2 n=1 Tax=Penaeus monodon TaxID=6687 RepID=UPI0018A7CF06|nr:uncharacterized protein LOC119580842 isoform X2 [Penaeus monodon]